MRRIILAILALAFCVNASAEAPKPAVRLGWSMAPVTAATRFGDENKEFRSDLQYIYKNYHKDIRSTGNFTIACDLVFNEWLSASMYFAYAGFSTDRFDGHSGEKTGEAKGGAFYAVPHISFTYYQNDVMRVYGTIGAGYCVYSGFEKGHGSGVIQFNPAGIQYGRKIFVFAELGFGTMFFGGLVGVGYKF